MPDLRERITLALAVLGNRRSLTVNQALKNLYGGNNTVSGIRVSEQSALNNRDVLTAVKILSDSFAQVPLKVYRKEPDGQRKEATNHPLYRILHDAPNPEMTSFQWREMSMAHLATWGNAYSMIERNGLNEVKALWPLLPDRTHPLRRKDGTLYYKTRGWVDGKERDLDLDFDEVLHFPGLSWDGIKGYSVIGLIREGVALSFAYEQLAARFFANDATPGFMLSSDKNVPDPSYTRLTEEFKRAHQGLRNKFEPYILDNGLKPVTVGMPLEDAQFIESRKFERGEILGFYRIPPHMAADVEKASSWGTGISEMTAGFIRFTMDPWFVRAEQVINTRLLGANAQGPLFCEFDREGFERGAFKERLDGYKQLFEMGAISNAQIARLENLPKPPAEVWVVATNFTPVDALAKQAQKNLDLMDKQLTEPANGQSKPKPDDGEGRAALMRAQRHVLTATVDRILRRERADVARLVEKHARNNDFDARVESFYKDHREYARKELAPVIETFADAICADVARETGKQPSRSANFTRSIAESVAVRVASSGREDLKKTITKTEPVWTVAAEQLAASEVVRVGNALAYNAYRDVGVRYVRWVARDLCDDCRTIDGRTVPTASPFTENIHHPPLCEDCSCVIVAHQTRTDDPAPISIHVTTPPVNLSPVINVEQPAAPNVEVHNNVPVPSVSVENTSPQPIVNVSAPSVEVRNEVATPTVEVTNQVATPIVNVQNDVQTPSVTVENRIEQPSGDIEIEPKPGGKLKISRKRKDA